MTMIIGFILFKDFSKIEWSFGKSMSLETMIFFRRSNVYAKTCIV